MTSGKHGRFVLGSIPPDSVSISSAFLLPEEHVASAMVHVVVKRQEVTHYEKNYTSGIYDYTGLDDVLICKLIRLSIIIFV